MSARKKKRKPDATGRVDMGEGRFVRLPHLILQSEAYRSLDLTARALLTEIVMLDNGKNNGSLWLSVADGKDRLGLSDARPAMRAFDDLADRGLTRMTKEAHFSVKAAETSRARCWRLTWLSWDGKPPSNEWRDYAAPAQSKAKKATERGLRALSRYRKGQGAQKFPVVDFTVTPPKAGET